MRSLTPCPSCRRHVESGETACPFCAAALEPSADARICQGPCSGHTSPRLGRVAMVAAGTTLLCAACMRSPGVLYGPAVIVDSAAETEDADGEADAGADGVPDAAR